MYTNLATGHPNVLKAHFVVAWRVTVEVAQIFVHLPRGHSLTVAVTVIVGVGLTGSMMSVGLTGSMTRVGFTIGVSWGIADATLKMGKITTVSQLEDVCVRVNGQ